MNDFRLKDFINGVTAKTRNGKSAEFVAMLKQGQPAPLVVNVDGKMENYFINGSYFGTNYEHEEDLQMA
jgi:hypothetical protein